MIGKNDFMQAGTIHTDNSQTTMPCPRCKGKGTFYDAEYDMHFECDHKPLPDGNWFHVNTNNSQTLANAEKRIEELEQEVKDREQDYVTLSQDKNAIIARLESQRDRLLEWLKKEHKASPTCDWNKEAGYPCPVCALIREIEGGQ